MGGQAVNPFCLPQNPTMDELVRWANDVTYMLTSGDYLAHTTDATFHNDVVFEGDVTFSGPGGDYVPYSGATGDVDLGIYSLALGDSDTLYNTDRLRGLVVGGDIADIPTYTKAWLYSNETTAGSRLLWLEMGADTSDTQSMIYFDRSDTGGANATDVAFNVMLRTNAKANPANNVDYLSLNSLKGGGGGMSAICIDEDGNVGIKVTEPNVAFDVSGAAAISGDTTLGGALDHDGPSLGFFGTATAAVQAVGDPDPGDYKVADNEIGGLSVSNPPTQAEVAALRDQCEDLADDHRTLRTKLGVLIDALQLYGLIT